jgi:hypothetical protein
MTECVDEQRTRHHRGQWCGFGPVRDREYILYAVFDDTERNGAFLTQKSFTTNLIQTSESVGRVAYLTRRIFETSIANGSSTEITTALVSAIRDLRADVRANAAIKNVRAVCVIDQVDPGDCDAHATMGYSEAIGPGLSQANLGKLRARIRLDLANTFSEIIPSDRHLWPRGWQILMKRAASVARVAFNLISRLLCSYTATWR